MNWEPIVTPALTTIVLAAAGTIVAALHWFTKKLTKSIEAERTTNGKIGIEANKNPSASVADVLARVEGQLVLDGMRPGAARLAVAAAQVKNGLPTGPDADRTKIDDVWTGTRIPQPGGDSCTTTRSTKPKPRS